MASTNKSLAQSAKSISPTLSYGILRYSIQSTEDATPIRGRYETRCKPMQCECVVDRPNQGLVRCANKATQRLTISHLKIRLLACEVRWLRLSEQNFRVDKWS